jgi:hypothetical protein
VVQQHKRRKRKRRYLKKDIPIVVLAAITIILLVVWSGLYWSESSEKKLIANANVNEQPLTIGKTLDSSGSIISEPKVNGEVSKHPKVIQSIEDKDTDTEKNTNTNTNTTETDSKNIDTPSSTNVDTQISTKSDTQSSTKSDTQNSTKSDTQSLTKSDTQIPTKLDTPSPTQSAPSSTNHTENSVDPALKYEQEITRIQEKCSLDMNAVLNTAENSFRQLDMRNPAEIQVWRDNLTTKLITAESTCETAFQEQIHLSENDSVSVEVIDKWINTYNDLKLRLKEESEAKLQALMGGR